MCRREGRCEKRNWLVPERDSALAPSRGQAGSVARTGRVRGHRGSPSACVWGACPPEQAGLASGPYEALQLQEETYCVKRGFAD